jgi:GPH family glycoside/pentoside/hexuronide:cation symporter
VRSGSQLYYFKYVTGSESASRGFMTAGMLAAMIGIALAPRITSRIGKRTAMIVLSAISALINASFFFLPPDNYPLLVGMNVLGALIGGPTGAIIWSMYADTADFIDWQHNRRITGLVYAGVLFAIKMGVAIGGALIGWVLALFNFVPNIAPSSEALFGIRFTFSIFPSLFSLISVGFMCAYRLTDCKVLEIEESLKQRKKAR